MVRKEVQEITLVRHGPSALALPTGWITAAQFRAWIERYNETGIAADSRPPLELVARAREAACIVCSDLPRAIESAKHLSPNCTLHTSALFREAGRPLDRDWPVKLPLTTWDRISVLLWRSGWITADESFQAACHRAREAAH